ncbi:MAG: LpxL/LpxP family acyltransferase, partial [Rudaea sp.]
GRALHSHGRNGDALDQGNHGFTQPVQSRIWDFVDCMRWYVAILYFLLRLTGRLPLRALHSVGAALGWLLWRLPNPLRRKAVTTLSHVRTQLEAKSSHDLLKPAMIEMGKGALELCKIWSGNPQAALALVREVRGIEHFDAALAARRGLIIAAPHLGCWELLNFWLCSRSPIAIAYRPPRRAEIEPLLIKARGALAPEQVRAEGSSGVRALFRRLSAGGVVGILPDQQPKAGEGEFAPFFGTPALTMVLLPRLAQRTRATVLFAFAERLPSGAGFRIHILPAPQGVADNDLPTAVTALNRGIEDCVRIAPVQYQWAYLRYSIRPPDAVVTPSAGA